MFIHQFYDKGLAHASYGVISQGKMAVIDPSRDPQPYLNLATEHGAQIVAVIETHPHADFISSHLELHKKTGAQIYVSKLVGASYPHHVFDGGDVIELGDISLKAINTPGHSPDSICIIAADEFGTKAVFTGDTLFVGDVGRPDLREHVGSITAQKEELAKQMYHSTREKLMALPPETLVYPAHGPGSLCGKNMSPDLHSTIGREIRENYALQLMSEPEFVKMLTADQPFIPRYFGFDVELNKQGAPSFMASVKHVPIISTTQQPQKGITVVDTRPAEQFKAGHPAQAINLQDGEKFETWLGSVINPNEQFYLIASDEIAAKAIISKTAKIGYEANIKAVLLNPSVQAAKSPALDADEFLGDTDRYTIVDVRNANETAATPVFEKSLNIPLPVLRERVAEIPADKPIVVHCAAGYRSAAASSILEALITNVPVYDFGERISSLLVH